MKRVTLITILLLASPRRFAMSSVSTAPAWLHSGSVRVAFGSCSGQDERQPLWHHIVKRSPSVFAWLGDVVYADHPRWGNTYEPATLDEVKAAYEQQLAHPEYATMLRSGVPIVGVFDDHDLGYNDADKKIVPRAFRLKSQQHLLDFLSTPPHSVLRHRDGAYSAHVIDGSPSGGRATVRSADASGPLPRAPGGGARVRLILLDVRSHKDPFPAAPLAGPGDAGAAPQDMLGATQWAFLEAQLNASSGDDVTIVASGIQVLGTADPLVSESWARLPQSQARLLALLRRYPRALLVSGDVHFGEANTVSPPGRAPLVELTSSGLSHSWSGALRGSLVHSMLLGTARSRLPAGGDARGACSSDVPVAAVSAALTRTARALGWGRVAAAVDAALSPGCYVSGLNWGEIDVDVNPSSGAPAGVTLRVWDEEGVARIEQRVPLAPPDAPGRAAAQQPAHVAAVDAAAAACLSEPLTNGLTAPCRAVLHASLPQPSTRELVAWYASHVFAALLLGVVATFALALPFATVSVAEGLSRERAGTAGMEKGAALPLSSRAAAAAVGFYGTARVFLWVLALMT